MSDSTEKTTSSPVPNRDLLMSALANPMRWTILKMLCDGEPRGALEIGSLTGLSQSAARKQMLMLVRGGICVQGRGRLYRITPRFFPKPDAPHVLDFGHCLIRLDLDTPAS